MDIKQLHADMQKTWSELKSTMEDRDKEIKQFGKETAETAALVTKLNDRIGQLETQLSRPGAIEAQKNGGGSGEMTAEQKAFFKYMREGKSGLTMDEKKALSTQSDPEGGFIVTEDFRKTLFSKLRDMVHIRQYATVIQTQQNSVGMPTFDYDGDAEWTAENAKISEEDFQDVFGKQSFTPHKLARIFRIPVELIEDAVFGVEEFLTDHFSRRFAEIEENAFINGDGNGKPLGLLAAVDKMNQVTKAAGQTTLGDITPEDLIELQYAVKSVYRGRGQWLMHRDMIKQARLMKDGNGQFMWQPGLQAGQPATILGRPALESEYMPTAAADAVGAIYGDLSYYWIVDRTNVATQRLTEKYAEYDQVGVKLRKRTDGAPTLGEPFSVLTLGSSS